MAIMIMTDLEGVSGVTRADQIDEANNPAGYRAACERLMGDLAAAVEGCLAAGEKEIYVVDGHGGGKNFIPSLLHPAARQAAVRGEWEELARGGGVKAMMEIGCHAMAGTLKAFLDHTQSSETWHDYYVSGERAGEIRQLALYAGARSIPVTMIAGDESACAEARALLSGVYTAPVKRGLRRNLARAYGEEECRARIREAARLGASRAREISPHRPKLPLRLELEYNRTDTCDAACEANAALSRLSARRVGKTVASIAFYADVLF